MSAFVQFLQSRIAATAGLSMLGTGGYVTYKDKRRFPRITSAFKTGALLAPVKDNNYETTYFLRPSIEKKLHYIMGPCFTNHYYLINGEVGTGKTRTVLEVTRELMRQAKETGKPGAPIYVMSSQGKSLPDSLAEAIHFDFDEHISFKFLLDFLLQIHSFPAKDDHNKMNRVLDAIEKAAFLYMQKEGRPAVIIIDGLRHIATEHPHTLQKLQEKAKLWADCNIVKLILIYNEEFVEEILQADASNWSRAAAPLTVRDLSKSDSIEFLSQADFYENKAVLPGNLNHPRIDSETAEKIYGLIGGRLSHLITYKRAVLENIPPDTIAESFCEKEREKFLHLKKTKNMNKALKLILDNSPGDIDSNKGCLDHGVLVSKLIAETSEETVDSLVDCSIIRYQRTTAGMLVMFESRLTENVVRNMELSH